MFRRKPAWIQPEGLVCALQGNNFIQFSVNGMPQIARLHMPKCLQLLAYRPSGLRCGVDEVFSFLGCYAGYVGSCLLKLKGQADKTAFFLECCLECLILEGSLSCNVRKQLRKRRQKINQQNAQINTGLIYYWSIIPTCFGPSVKAIIREFEILEGYKAIVLIC